jgi:hypothetical protein
MPEKIGFVGLGIMGYLAQHVAHHAREAQGYGHESREVSRVPVHLRQEPRSAEDTAFMNQAEQPCESFRWSRLRSLYRGSIVTGLGNPQEPILAYINVLEGEGLAEKESGRWRRWAS